jgi:hypothetical protein
MTKRFTQVFREILQRWERYSTQQFTAPLTISVFQDGR